jgi:serine protease Do
VDGVSTGTSRSFKDEIASKKPGQTVVLKTVRAKQHLDVKVTMGALLPDAQPGNEESEKLQSETTPEFGLTVETLDKKLAQERNVESIPGILITAVDPGSGAYDQGVKVGDIITEINRKPVTTSRQFQDALKKADKKRAVMLNIVNDGSSRLVLLKAGD